MKSLLFFNSNKDFYKKTMKKIYILLVLSTTFSFAQIINIPDPNFKALLLQANTTNNIAGGVKVDINDNGEIEQNEALLVYVIVIQTDNNISDLTGIEYFTNIVYLTCSSNHLVSANLSTLTQLAALDFGGNQLIVEEINLQK